MTAHTLTYRKTWLGGVAALIAIGCGGGAPDTTTVTSEITGSPFPNVSAADNPGAVQIFHHYIRPCSGTLLHDRWVLTAAHCDLGMGFAVTPPSYVTPADSSQPGEPPLSGWVQAVEMAKFRWPDVDLMLLRLEKPLSLAQRGPVGLWNGDNADVVPSLSLVDYGFGIDRECLGQNDYAGSGVLRKATFPADHTHDTILFVKEESTTMSCHGDSGGPLFATTDKLGRSLLGVAATNLHPASGGSQLALKANVNEFRGFIRSTISSPGNVTGPGSNRSNIFLAGASSWSTFYGASVDAGGTATHNAATSTLLFGTSGFINATHESGAKLFMGDFDGDGFADIGVVGGSSGFMRARSTGTAWQFSAPSISGTSTFNTMARVAGARPVAGDFDADGHTDVALLGGTGWTTVPIGWPKSGGFQYTNLTDSTLATAARQTAAQVVAGDFDGDGRDDIAVAGTTAGSITIGFSNGDGRFRTVTLDATTTPNGVTFASAAFDPKAKLLAGDFNGDGRDDLAVAGSLSVGNVIPIAFAVNGGTFLFPTPLPVNDFPGYSREDNVRAVAGDFDGDGRADIALAGGGHWNTVPIAYSNGDTTFRVTNNFVATFPGLAADTGAKLLAMRGGGFKKPAHEATKVVAASSIDGRLQAFYIGTDGALYTNVEIMPNGAGELWSGEYPMGGYAKDIAVDNDASGRIQLFYVGSNDVLHYRRQALASSSVWEDQVVLGPTARTIAVGKQQNQRLDLFFNGIDFGNYHMRQEVDGTWTGPHSLGGLSKQIVTIKDENGRQNIFTLGTDDHIHMNQETAQNSGIWVGESPAGGMPGSASVQQIGVGRDPGNVLYLTYYETSVVGFYRKFPGQPWQGPFGSGNGSTVGVRPFAFGRTSSSLIVFMGTFYRTASGGDLSSLLGQTNPNPGNVQPLETPSVAVSASIPHEMVYIQNHFLYHSRQDASGAWLPERRLDPRPQL